MNSKSKKLDAFARLLDIMDLLRNDCPWDKKQTIESLRRLTIRGNIRIVRINLERRQEWYKRRTW